MIKLNKNGQAVEIYEYDRDNIEIQRPIYNVGEYSNVEFTNEASASIPRKTIKRIKTVNPKQVARNVMKQNFERNVAREQYFSGTNYADVEAALNQAYEFDPNLAEFGPISDYPQIVNAKRNMNFNGPEARLRRADTARKASLWANGQPQMGSWFSDVTGINFDISEEIQELSPEDAAQAAKELAQATGIIPTQSSGGVPTTVRPPSVTPPKTGAIASTIPGASGLSSLLPATLTLQQKKYIVYGIYGLVGLVALNFIIPLVKNLIPKRA